MGIFDVRKIDCHAHVLDPLRFPYAQGAAYRPSGQEIGTTDQFVEVLQCYGTEHVLLVQPNSGYGPDNSCMLDAIRRYPGIFKGVAIASLDADLSHLRDLRDQGIVGIALNPTFYGNDFYADSPALMEKLAELDMFVQIQVQHDQLLMFKPWIERIAVRVLIDHCGRPTPEQGLAQPGFSALLDLAETGRVHVKLSGYAKFAKTPYPFRDTLPFVRALVEAFGLDHCMWASDWPYLRAADRQDYGPLLKLLDTLFPDPADRDILLWQTPKRLFGFGA
ncbi:amidohydrolase [Neorhizobium sp. T25_13]|uniref:amidohydrolase family protein n=1 Tax=Neorhizobium sp. T25_13 TaxID=2093830 RepID=UPI000CF8D027|nr:amidohydrolase family protein [Neorhizobium sp. T25_13]